MAYTIVLRPRARRDLKRLPQDVLRRVNARIRSLADDPRPSGVEKLSGSDNSYRIRVGPYRILYEIRDIVLVVCVVRVRRRRESYR